MPAKYFYIINKYIGHLIDSKSFNKLDDYLLNDFDDEKLKEISVSKSSIGEFVEISKNFTDKINEILIYAVSKLNFDVVYYYQKHIDIFYYKNENSYSLIDLVIDCYKNSDKNSESKLKYLKMMEFLVISYKLSSRKKTIFNSDFLIDRIDKYDIAAIKILSKIKS